MVRIVIFFILCSATSCGIGVQSTGKYKLYTTEEIGKEPGKGVFIQLNNGQVIEGKSVRVKRSETKKIEECSVIIDKVAYDCSEVWAYQNAETYHRRVGTSQQYYMRILKGKLSIYYKIDLYFYTTAANKQTTRANYKYYFLKNDEGEMIPWDSFEALANVVKDNPRAYALVDECRAKGNNRKRFDCQKNIIETYNAN
jgi:hypothetical protein